MPPKRRAQTRRTPSSQQSTLSFHGKQSRVTKPSQTQQSKTTKDAALLEDVPSIDVRLGKEPDLEESTTVEKAIEDRAEQEAATIDSALDPLQHDGGVTRTEDVLGGRADESLRGAVGGQGSGWVADEEARARKISTTQIKRYWREKEQKRLAPRIHQEGMSVNEKILREWDMSGQYGPCIGIARLKRWKRANLLGLDPPLEVLAVLLQEMDSGDSANSQRAYVDELLSSRFVET